MAQNSIHEKLHFQAKVYGRLFRAAESLLTCDSLFCTEKLLLKIVTALSRPAGGIHTKVYGFHQ